MRKLSLRVFLALVLLYYICDPINAQKAINLAQAEQKIKSEYSRVLNLDAFKRELASRLLADSLFAVIQNDSSFEFPFNSLDKIGKIFSPDHLLRIYCWNVPFGIDQNLYFSIMQYYGKREKKFYTIMMQGNPDQKGILTPANWPGTLYYEIVETKHAGQKYYTLLGFDLNNLLTNKKVIDVITIDEFDELSFCPRLFLYNGKLTDRIVFEFNEKTTMSLRYNEVKKMIVFDHLSPEKPSMEGNYQSYGPDFTYDGLKFEKGIWVLYSNIDVTN